jgi:hypothetical protein
MKRHRFLPTFRPSHPSTDQGIALLIAIAVLAALGVVTLTALALARAERIAGLGAISRVQARAAAEAALADAMRGWPASSTPLAPGAETHLVDVHVLGPAEGLASVRALGGSIYALRASGVRVSLAGDSLGFARLELLVLLQGPDSLGMVHPRPYPRGWRSLP